MRHFAQLDGSNIVLNVIDIENVTNPQDGAVFCSSLIPDSVRWVQTFMPDEWQSGNPLNYAARGDTFDEGRNGFIRPKPSPTATLDEETLQWIDSN